jgi:hypothetical protein
VYIGPKTTVQSAETAPSTNGIAAKRLEGGNPADRAAVREALQQWQQDSDLAGLRDEDALAKMPVAEREACQTLWAEVEALLQKTRGAK